jgi:hypothetical protein
LAQVRSIVTAIASSSRANSKPGSELKTAAELIYLEEVRRSSLFRQGSGRDRQVFFRAS